MQALCRTMVAQRGICTDSSGPPIRYDAVECYLSAIAEYAVRLSATVHQLFGEDLCLESARMLSENPNADPWN